MTRWLGAVRTAGRRRDVYRAIDQYRQIIDVSGLGAT